MAWSNALGSFCPNTVVANLSQPENAFQPQDPVASTLSILRSWHRLPRPEGLGRVALPANSILLLKNGSVVRHRVFIGEGEAPTPEEIAAAHTELERFSLFLGMQLWGVPPTYQIEATSGLEFAMNWTPRVEPGVLVPESKLSAVVATFPKVVWHAAEPAVKVYFVGDEPLALNTWLLRGRVDESSGPDEATETVQDLANALMSVVGGRAVGVDASWLGREIGCWIAERSV